MTTGDRVQLRVLTNQLHEAGLHVGSKGTVYDVRGLWGVEFDDANLTRHRAARIVHFHTVRDGEIVSVIDLCDPLAAEVTD